MKLFPALFCLSLLMAAEVRADTPLLPSLALVPGFQHWQQLLVQHQTVEHRLRQLQSSLPSSGIHDRKYMSLKELCSTSMLLGYK